MLSTWFSTYYDRLMHPLEKKAFSSIRHDLLKKATGEVLEIGSGTGINFQYYAQVRVTALEPSDHMREQSLIRAKHSNVPITLVSGSAESLPFPDGTFDTVVGTLVLCSVESPQKAISEIKRVLKPDGRILLFEHVRLNDSPLGKLQDLLTPVWKKVCDGCHLNRDTVAYLNAEGIKPVSIEPHFRNIFVALEGKLMNEE